jgi:Tol biopolymer transport system component
MPRPGGTLGVVVTTVLLGLLAAPSASATYPDTNGPIAFSQGDLFPNESDLSQHSQVFTIAPGGGSVTQLTHVTAHQAAAAPDWSPDGQKIVYESDQSGRFAIWVMNADGSGQTQLTQPAGFEDFLPSWSPDGNRIVFSRCADPFDFRFFAGCDIAVMNANGGGEKTLLSTGHWLNLRAEFSPDGKQIAFQSDMGGLQSAIWAMDANGNSLRRLTKPRLRAFWPDWAPDGERILFTDHCCIPHSNLWSVHPDGTGLRRVTRFRRLSLDAAFPSFSPDGQQIVFFFSRGCGDKPCKHFYTARSDGSHPRRVVTGKSNTFLTDWGPGN